MLLGVAIAGCGPNMEEAIATHGAKVEQKLATVARVGAMVPTTPLLERDAVEGSPGLVLQGIDAKPGGNAAVIYVEDFRELTELGLVYARMDHSALVPTCAALVRTQREPWSAEQPDRAPSTGFGYSASKKFEACEALDYLLVVRTLAFAKPAVLPRTSTWSECHSRPTDAGTSDGGALTDAGAESWASNFEGGYLKAEVLVFSLDGPRLVGGFRFEAESTETVSSASALALETNLESNVTAAFVGAASRAMPTGRFKP